MFANISKNILEIRTDKEKKVTTFAALPNNTTTWQSISNNQVSDHSNPPSDNGKPI